METDVRVPGQSPRPTDLGVFDRVHDTENTAGILVVLRVHNTRSSAFELTDGVSVADVHTSYPPTDAVVEVAYERRLDTCFPAWRDHDPEDITDHLGHGDLHYYPVGKLESYTAGNYTETEDGCRCEHCETMLESTTTWVEHLIRECTDF